MGEVLEIFKRVDAHGHDVSLSTYCLSVPQDDVKLAELLYHDVFGPPAEWPTPGEVERRKKQKLVKADAITEVAESDDEGDEQLRVARRFTKAGMSRVSFVCTCLLS